MIAQRTERKRLERINSQIIAVPIREKSIIIDDTVTLKIPQNS